MEASLRDGIRGRSLVLEPLTTSVRRARQRGVQIRLLDDAPQAIPHGPVAQLTAEWVAGIIDGMPARTITIRTFVSEGLRATTVTGEAPDSHRTLLLPLDGGRGLRATAASSDRRTPIGFWTRSHRRR